MQLQPKQRRILFEFLKSNFVICVILLSYLSGCVSDCGRVCVCVCVARGACHLCATYNRHHPQSTHRSNSYAPHHHAQLTTSTTADWRHPIHAHVYIRTENLANRATFREGEQLRRTTSLLAVRQDRVQRAQPLLCAFSRQIFVPKLFGCLHTE